MESVNNMAAAASKATTVEGRQGVNPDINEAHGREPISGVQGVVRKNEPFDKGNTTTGTSSNPLTHNTHETSTIGSSNQYSNSSSTGTGSVGDNIVGVNDGNTSHTFTPSSAVGSNTQNSGFSKSPLDPSSSVRETPSDSSGISHPKTFDPSSSPVPPTANPSKPTSSEPNAAATLQGNTTTSVPAMRKPEASSGPDTGAYKSEHGHEQHRPKPASEEDAEISKKPRKDHETTTREIKATQEKAMAGTHPAEKEGEALREKDDTETKSKAPPTLEPHTSHGSQEASDATHEKAGLKEKLLAKVHHH